MLPGIRIRVCIGGSTEEGDKGGGYGEADLAKR